MLRTQIDKSKILDTVLQLHADEKLQPCDKWCLNKAPTGSRPAVKMTALEVKHYSACINRIKATMVLNLRELTCVSGFPLQSPASGSRTNLQTGTFDHLRYVWRWNGLYFTSRQVWALAIGQTWWQRLVITQDDELALHLSNQMRKSLKFFCSQVDLIAPADYFFLFHWCHFKNATRKVNGGCKTVWWNQ